MKHTSQIFKNFMKMSQNVANVLKKSVMKKCHKTWHLCLKKNGNKKMFITKCLKNIMKRQICKKIGHEKMPTTKCFHNVTKHDICVLKNGNEKMFVTKCPKMLWNGDTAFFSRTVVLKFYSVVLFRGFRVLFFLARWKIVVTVTNTVIFLHCRRSETRLFASVWKNVPHYW